MERSMKNLQAVLFVLLILVFSGCVSSGGINQLSLLTKNSWILSKQMGSDVDLSKFVAGFPTLDFLEGGNLAGFSGCNNFSGSFTFKGTEIQLDPGAMTRKACPGDGDGEFISALNRAKNFTIEKEKLTLLDGVTELMSFVPNKTSR